MPLDVLQTRGLTATQDVFKIAMLDQCKTGNMQVSCPLHNEVHLILISFDEVHWSFIRKTAFPLELVRRTRRTRTESELVGLN